MSELSKKVKFDAPALFGTLIVSGVGYRVKQSIMYTMGITVFILVLSAVTFFVVPADSRTSIFGASFGLLVFSLLLASPFLIVTIYNNWGLQVAVLQNGLIFERRAIRHEILWSKIDKYESRKANSSLEHDTLKIYGMGFGSLNLGVPITNSRFVKETTSDLLTGEFIKRIDTALNDKGYFDKGDLLITPESLMVKSNSVSWDDIDEVFFLLANSYELRVVTDKKTLVIKLRTDEYFLVEYITLKVRQSLNQRKLRDKTE